MVQEISKNTGSDAKIGDSTHKPSKSAIPDNYQSGSVGDFLRDAITPESTIAIVSAYFTIHAYAKLKEKFDAINRLKFLFGEPTFIKSVNPSGERQCAF